MIQKVNKAWGGYQSWLIFSGTGRRPVVDEYELNGEIHHIHPFIEPPKEAVEVLNLQADETHIAGVRWTERKKS